MTNKIHFAPANSRTGLFGLKSGCFLFGDGCCFLLFQDCEINFFLLNLNNSLWASLLVLFPFRVFVFLLRGVRICSRLFVVDYLRGFTGFLECLFWFRESCCLKWCFGYFDLMLKIEFCCSVI
jgi:hypothetical protein